MPGCSSPPVISASSRNRGRLSGSSACRSWISFRATSRCSSSSWATKTSPSPPRACGRRMRNRGRRRSAARRAGARWRRGRRPPAGRRRRGPGWPARRGRRSAPGRSRTEPIELRAARLCAGRRRAAAGACATSGSSRACSSSASAPCSTRIRPRGLALSRTQACMAAIRASRVMKSICSARMPNSRLRSASACGIVVASPGRAERPARAGWTGLRPSGRTGSGPAAS